MVWNADVQNYFNLLCEFRYSFLFLTLYITLVENFQRFVNRKSTKILFQKFLQICRTKNEECDMKLWICMTFHPKFSSNTPSYFDYFGFMVRPSVLLYITPFFFFIFNWNQSLITIYYSISIQSIVYVYVYKSKILKKEAPNWYRWAQAKKISKINE